MQMFTHSPVPGSPFWVNGEYADLGEGCRALQLLRAAGEGCSVFPTLGRSSSWAGVLQAEPGAFFSL